MNSKINYNDVTAIVLAGGKGTRMGTKTPKQYLSLGDKKVVEYSIEKFQPIFQEVLVIVPDLESSNFLIDKYQKIKFMEASSSRITSLLDALDKIKTKYVLIHDASRPFVTKGIIDEIIKNLVLYDCVYPTMPLSSSIVEDRNGLLFFSPDRSKFREIQTPQGFKKSVLKDALRNFGEQHIHIPELVRLSGVNVKHIDGSPWLFKITYQPDIHAARYYIKHEGLGD